MTDEVESRGRVALGHRVASARLKKFGTVDAARIHAGIARASWDKVEKGTKVRDYTLTAVEKALGWPLGTARRIIEGEESSGVYEVQGSFREWVLTTDILSEPQRREILRVMDTMANADDPALMGIGDALEDAAPPESPSSQHAEEA